MRKLDGYHSSGNLNMEEDIVLFLDFGPLSVCLARNDMVTPGRRIIPITRDNKNASGSFREDLLLTVNT